MRRSITVRGRVQGVGYRYFVVNAAKQLGLTGWVRNCSNGDVECEAQGEPAKLEVFLSRLKTGHTWARVDGISGEPVQEKKDEQGFEIRS